MAHCKKKVLYLPSTPLNVLVSVAHASVFSEQQTSEIVLIDQKRLKNNLYYDALNAWKDTPFEKVSLTLGQAKGWRKIVERKRNFRELKCLFEGFQPDVIAVGSDRRVEFQYLMHLCQHTNPAVEGWYLDDGLYSYSGRPYKSIKDGVNSLLKKISYGFWWQEPKTVGASDWIKRVWLFQPKYAMTILQAKNCETLEPKWFTSAQIKNFSKVVASTCQMHALELQMLGTVGVFLLIPHPNNIKKMSGYEGRIFKFLDSLKQKGISVAVKYHPRTVQEDPLGFIEKYGALLLPSSLAFEYVLPFLKQGAYIIGDVGTALLTAQWLRPDLNVFAVLAENDAFQASFKNIYAQLDLRVVAEFKDIHVSRTAS